MSTNDRDTHFQGWAEHVAQKLKEQQLLDIGNHIKPLVDPPIDVEYEKVKLILARAAYDLTYHTRYETGYGMDLLFIREWIESSVPDMTELPD